VRTRLLIAPLVLLPALAAAAPASAEDHVVDVVDFRFAPDSLQIDRGDTVVWNFEADRHMSTSARGEREHWNSGAVAAGQAFRHTFSEPGRFSYICIPHEVAGMTGVVQWAVMSSRGQRLAFASGAGAGRSPSPSGSSSRRGSR
jgi:plastocyanin